MKNGPRQLNMPEMARTVRHVPATRQTLEIPVNGAHPGIQKPAHLGALILHGLVKVDFSDGHGLCLVGRQNAELDVAHGAERGGGVREAMHGNGRHEN